MPALEEDVHGDNKEKTQLDFEVSVMQRVSGGGGDSFPNNCELVVL